MEQMTSNVTVHLNDPQHRLALRAFLDVLDKVQMLTVAPTSNKEKPGATTATNNRKPVETPKEKPQAQQEDDLTMDDLTSKVRSIAESNPEFTKGLKGLLKPYGVDRVSNLDPADWGNFYDKLSAY